MNIARYVLRRLRAHGAEVLFGIPGTSCSALFDEAPGEGLKVVVTSSELEAGYAADAYARVRGLAAVSVSYGVGTLSLVNGIAGAFVERGAVVVVNGGPSVRDLWTERHRAVLFSHSTGRPSTDLHVFEQVTAFAARADTVADVPRLVDRAVTIALREQRPVYIEVPRDLWRVPCIEPVGALDPSRPATGSEETIATRIVQRLRAAERPAILLGEEIARYRLQADAAALLGRTGLPWATTLLGKSVLPEDTPNFIGVYDSDLAPKPVREVVENADVLLALGCVFGVDHTFLVSKSFNRIVHALDGIVRVQNDAAERAELKPLLAALTAVAEPSTGVRLGYAPPAAAQSYGARRSWTGGPAELTSSLTHEELFAEIDAHLSEGWFVIVDTCLGSYPAADLAVQGAGGFMGDPVWLSIGHSVGAAVGVAFASERPVLVICGDGGFQMTAQAVSTLARYGRTALVLVIDNGTYAIEQYLIDPKYFEDPTHDELPYVRLNRWDYAGLGRALRATFTRDVADRPALRQVLRDARTTGGTGVVAVRVDPRDLPPENRAPMVSGALRGGARHDSHHRVDNGREHEIARLGDLQVVSRGATTNRRASARDGATVLRLDGRAPLRVVVQKGRSFQRANPHVPVLVDRGRFLVVELSAETPVHEEPGSFAITEADGPPVGFRVERAVPGSPRSQVTDILQRLSPNELEQKVRALASLKTRHSLMPAFKPALDLAERWLRAAVPDVQRVEVRIPGGATANLIAERRGASTERRLFIICAHLDSVNHEGGPNALAPGADDNASGSATVVAIAEAVSGEALRHDVNFILFGGEEQNLFGSEAYVAGLSAADRARLAGVVNIDMAASRNTADHTVLLEGSEVSRAVMGSLAQAAATYTSLVTQLSFDPFASDHVPFIKKGLPAVLTIEGADSAYPHEHTARDTPDRLDYELHRQITAMNLAWLLEQTL